MNTKTSRNDFHQLIQRLSDEIEIDELAERLGLSVKRSGDRALSLCVEHNEKNPSMQLYKNSSTDRSHYHCFSCHAHGDIFKLTQVVRNIDFSSSVKWLAESYGYTIPNQSVRAKSKTNTSLSKRKEPEKITNDTETLETALKIYKANSSKWLGHWLKLRNLKPSTSAAAEISLAPPKTLYRAIELQKNNYGEFRATLEQFESNGLIRREISDLTNENIQNLNLGNSYRDFFYDERVIFPLRDKYNKLVGFAGRKTKEGTRSPKYLYSPNLAKSSILYRYHEAASKIKLLLKEKKQPNLYICEGLLDCLRLEELGYAAVSILGSSISENQAQILVDLANTLPESSALHLKIFLDRDDAGLKGSATSIEKILNKDTNFRLEVSFIWVLDDDITSEMKGAKDPDELLTSYQTIEEAESFLNRSVRPAALALISERLKISPAIILDDAAWSSIPEGAKFRAGQYLLAISQGFPARLLATSNSSSSEDFHWTKELEEYSKPKKSREKISYRVSPDQNQSLKLNLARDLAQSGANKGELLSDIAAWRRLSLAATTFNEGFASRLKQNQFQPIEPFDAVHVSRGFGKNEPRLKSMPCPEDLIIQQYIMNELLSEHLDSGSALGFSRFIPAVRFYRGLDSKKTTGEPNGSSYDETLSFAYQIDMDVLEGRHPPSSGGIFRPFFDCWKEFIASLISQGEGMSQVHMIRLDLKRYYDNIKRAVMKGMLQDCLNHAFETLDNPGDFAPLFQPEGFIDERNRAVVDFLVDQSFGFSYYHPDSGETKKSDRERGIPQGPVLSAWLGNSLLFKLDSKIRGKLQEYNNDGQSRAGYARYVDDVVIISDSLDVLNALRATVEDVTSSLGLEMVPKESFAPMSAQDFLDELTSGRALAVSGPREETEIFEIEDFEYGWGAWQDQQITRQNSLELLRDTRLYQASPETIKNQLFTALRARDLRPSELAKAARWIWYISVIDSKDKNSDAIDAFWEVWNSVCQNLPFELNKELPWDDPSFYALEGLQNLLERANNIDYGADPVEANSRQNGIINLARAACNSQFFEPFHTSKPNLSPDGWGQGTRRLKRMFVQRIICIQWMASQLSSQTIGVSETDSFALSIIEKQNARFKLSLKRAIITATETSGRNTTGLTVSGDPSDEWNFLHDAFLWLHKAIVCLAINSDSNANDPLVDSAPELDSIASKARDPSSAFALDDDNYLSILKCLLPSGDNYEYVSDDHDPSGEIILLALQTFAAITPREALPHLLVNRYHLLQDSGTKIPFPPLPGIPANGLLLYSERLSDSNWVKISKIWWVTLPSLNDESEETKNPTFKVSTADAPSREFFPDWKTAAKVGKLEIFEAELPENHTLWNLSSPPRFDIDAAKLKWIADAFEAISRINKSSHSSQQEYVPAWPYLLTSNRPDRNDDSTLTISLLTPSYPTISLDGLAFVRDGSRGLRTIEVPEQYGQLWRTGVFLSELAGFRRDIDTFAKISSENGDTISNQELLEPATHLLRNVLRKLRGTYFKDQVLSVLEDEDHLPATVTRSLELLRGFPTDGQLREEISYVISSEAETAAMHIRLSGKIYPFSSGLFSQYIEKVALKVLHTVPPTWIAELSDLEESASLLKTNRVIPATYLELAKQFSKLRNAHTSTPLQASSLSAIIVGCKIAAISSWARELAFMIQALGEENWPFPADGELTQTWGIPEKGFLLDQEEDSIPFLNEYFTKQTKTNVSEAAFTKITPFGWLTLVLGRTGLFGEHRKLPLAEEWKISTKDKLKNLIILLSNTPEKSEKIQPFLAEDWPFEFDGDEAFSSWDEPWVVEAINCLSAVEANLKLTIREATGAWKLNSSENSFKSNSGEEWNIFRWQIALSGGVRPERLQQGLKIFSIWQETYSSDGVLVLVSARDEKLSKLVNSNRNFNNPPEQAEDIEDTIHEPHNEFSPLDVKSLDVAIDSIAIDNQQQPQPSQLEHPQKSSAAFEGADSTNTPDLHASTWKDWRSLQERVWDPRQQRSPGHIRIAIMQWDLHDTYRHPIVDSNDWNDILPPIKEPLSSESRRELRRRKFLSEALSACKSLGVDLLVLPEYSVRPDTIKWLREQIKRKPGMPAVLAGTYKLYGNTMDPGFKEVYDGVLGLSDHLKTFSTLPPSKPKAYLSGEHSSILTLIAPLNLSNGERIACTFSRRKKYSSLAASEVFSPLLEDLSPLFSPDFLLSEIKRRAADGASTTSDNDIKPEEILAYSKQLKYLSYSTEFICSELFLPMSPVNYRALASELRKQAIKFGHTMSSERAEAILIDDLISMSQYLGLSGDGDSRRSIIIVPAMTSRSADYWIFGQATLLSGGATTVFCNAVSKKQAIGGSCFIGRESWNNSKKSIFHDLITPYAGWSKGIYYNNPNDALGQTEQAVIVADIDPSFMQEGKPRPQALAVPLQLVAYLPIAELTEKSRGDFYSALSKSIALINTAEMAGRIVSPDTPGISQTHGLISQVFTGENLRPLEERYDHWRDHWRANPTAGIPPVITDWLTVDLFDEKDSTPDIFIPPYPPKEN